MMEFNRESREITKIKVTRPPHLLLDQEAEKTLVGLEFCGFRAPQDWVELTCKTLEERPTRSGILVTRAAIINTLKDTNQTASLWFDNNIPGTHPFILISDEECEIVNTTQYSDI